MFLFNLLTHTHKHKQTRYSTKHCAQEYPFVVSFQKSKLVVLCQFPEIPDFEVGGAWNDIIFPWLVSQKTHTKPDLMPLSRPTLWEALLNYSHFGQKIPQKKLKAELEKVCHSSEKLLNVHQP